MPLVAAAAFILFWVRDCSVLRMGPPRRIPQRLCVYVISLAVTAVLVWFAAARADSFQFGRLGKSFSLILTLTAWQVAATLVCLWLRSTERYDLAWLAAVIPAPAFWMLWARVVLGSASTLAEPGMWCVYGAVFTAWVLLMARRVLRLAPTEMPADELDFAVDMPGWINCIGIGLLALAAAVDAI